MNLTISGHHLEVTPALREYVLTKLERVTRHFDQVVDVNVLLTVEKLKEKERRQRCEVTLHVKGRDIFVEQAHEDLYAAIDQLMGVHVEHSWMFVVYMACLVNEVPDATPGTVSSTTSSGAACVEANYSSNERATWLDEK